jgi:hypothetical protein
MARWRHKAMHSLRLAKWRIGHLLANNLARVYLVAATLDLALVSATMQRMNIDEVIFRRLKGARSLSHPLVLRRIAWMLRSWFETSRNWLSKQQGTFE